MSSSVYESLPPDRHTITRSPCSIMRKSSIALPTCPRKCACRRLKLFEDLGVDCGTADIRSTFEVFGFNVAQPRSGRQRPAGGFADQLRHADSRSNAVHVLPQPVEQAAEMPGRDLIVQFGAIGAQALVQLAGDHRAD